ncbi:DUF1499 domain-containing protein [Allorhodopirellula heiligendammensis]|nr:DUF1499 domain-containing protein [Allorhodopirellula heiligendammensis]
MKKMLGYAAITIGVAITGRLFWMIDDWSRDWTTNNARLSITDPDPLLRPFEVAGDIPAVIKKIKSWVAGQPGWDLAPGETTEPGDRLHLTRTTPVFRFVDDIWVELTPQQPATGELPRTRVDACSQSRVGKGDLGQNPRNLKVLRAGILGDSS